MPRIDSAFKGNWASDFKCLILFNTAGESVIISGAGCSKMGMPAPVVDRDLHPYAIQAFPNAIHLRRFVGISLIGASGRTAPGGALSRELAPTTRWHARIAVYEACRPNQSHPRA